MQTVKIYTTGSCPYCIQAKQLLKERGIAVLDEIRVDLVPGERDQAIDLLRTDTRAVVILEAPHRIEALAKALGVLQGRLVTVGRELTKQFEEIATLPAQDFSAWLDAGAQRTRGEFALVLHSSISLEVPDDSLRVLKALLTELPLKTAVKLAAQITNTPRNELYATALKLKQE